MAWTDLTFAFGSLLTATKMTQLDDNFDALASGASGAPPISCSNALDQSYTYGSQSIGAGATWTPSAGFYFTTTAGNNISMRWEIYNGATWQGDQSGSGCVLCDGSNQRLKNKTADTHTAHYHKFD